MTKLNREMILRGLLQTLVDGYGRKAVESTLAALDGPTDSSERKQPEASHESAPRGAEAMVVALEAPSERKALLIDLAKRFDEGTAFPKLSDIRSFLSAHQQGAGELKGRTPAFRRMLPILSAMSNKGLEKLISRSHHTGPADLSDISDAIRGAGEHLRGRREEEVVQVPDAVPDPEALDHGSEPERTGQNSGSSAPGTATGQKSLRS